MYSDNTAYCVFSKIMHFLLLYNIYYVKSSNKNRGRGVLKVEPDLKRGGGDCMSKSSLSSLRKFLSRVKSCLKEKGVWVND